jgi:hypothetical protein
MDALRKSLAEKAPPERKVSDEGKTGTKGSRRARRPKKTGARAKKLS